MIGDDICSCIIPGFPVFFKGADDFREDLVPVLIDGFKRFEQKDPFGIGSPVGIEYPVGIKIFPKFGFPLSGFPVGTRDKHVWRKRVACSYPESSGGK